MLACVPTSWIKKTHQLFRITEQMFECGQLISARSASNHKFMAVILLALIYVVI